MAVVIARSRPVAQVFRLVGTLVAMLLVMSFGIGIAQWRSTKQNGSSPYGALAALQPAPAGLPAPPAPTSPPDTRVAQAATPSSPASADPAPAQPPAAAGAVVPPADPARSGPRIIPLKGGVDPTPPARPAAAVMAPAPAVAQPPPAAAGARPDGSSSSASLPPPGKPPEDAPAGAININTASVEDLNNIPGGGRIGRTIVRHRPYGSIEDLVDHRVLRASEFARIRSRITAN